MSYSDNYNYVLPRPALHVNSSLQKMMSDEIKQLRETNKEKDKELKDLRGKSERYWMASLFLFIIVAACLVLIANRQWELDAALQKNNDCTDKMIHLREKLAECEPELKTCRMELNNFYKSKCFVNEQNIREDNSIALVKQAENLMILLSRQDNYIEREAERNDVCEKHLRQAETEARQLLEKITVLVQEKEQLNSTYKSCAEQLGAYNLKKTE